MVTCPWLVNTRKTSSNLNTDARGSRELEQSDAKVLVRWVDTRRWIKSTKTDQEEHLEKLFLLIKLSATNRSIFWFRGFSGCRQVECITITSGVFTSRRGGGTFSRRNICSAVASLFKPRRCSAPIRVAPIRGAVPVWEGRLSVPSRAEWWCTARGARGPFSIGSSWTFSTAHGTPSVSSAASVTATWPKNVSRETESSIAKLTFSGKIWSCLHSGCLTSSNFWTNPLLKNVSCRIYLPLFSSYADEAHFVD